MKRNFCYGMKGAITWRDSFQFNREDFSVSTSLFPRLIILPFTARCLESWNYLENTYLEPYVPSIWYFQPLKRSIRNFDFLPRFHLLSRVWNNLLWHTGVKRKKKNVGTERTYNKICFYGNVYVTLRMSFTEEKRLSGSHHSRWESSFYFIETFSSFDLRVELNKSRCLCEELEVNNEKFKGSTSSLMRIFPS